MKAEIITIGDEILIGQIIDTNSAWMAQELNLVGIQIKQISSISDNREHILKALDEAAERADIILITGGLGPTKDDITKTTLCDYFNTKLRFDADVFSDVETIFRNRKTPMLEVNRKQAEVPENCIVLRNKNGTAPGMWFAQKNKIFVSMPGVPFEMKALMETEVIPRLKNNFSLPFILHRTVLTQGIGESFLANKIAAWEESLEKSGIKLAYLPSSGMVRLRLSASGKEKGILEKIVAEKIKTLESLIPEHIFGYEKQTLEEIVGQLLIEKRKTIAIAESCTGGYLSHLITRVSGSSGYFKGAIIPYSNELKINELNVNPNDINQFGAVSKEVVEAMAKNTLQKMNVDFSIAISGIAGPTGGTNEKPVGTVWIAVASQKNIFSQQFLFGTHRERNIERASITALNVFRKFLLAE
ncbi:MAG: competence/damage-inducible protein A [Bacteroidia bacterium]